MNDPLRILAQSGAPALASGTQTQLPSGPVLFAAPHRAFFLAGAIQTVLSFLPWVWTLLARAGIGSEPVLPWPPGWVHGFSAIFGVFPFFIFGFLLTAMPRWQGLPDTPGSAARVPVSLLAAGWLCFDAGLLVDLGFLRAGGLGMVLAGWGVLLVRLHPVAFRPGVQRLHAGNAWLALAAGALGLALWLGVALGASPELARVGLSVGLWWLLAPIFMVVCHRMIPFFSSSALPRYEPYRPDWTLYLLLAASLVHGALRMVGADAWTWVADLPAAGTAFWLSWKWQMRRSFAVRLLAMLHLGFAWLGVAWLLSGVQSGLALGGVGVLGLAPFHALAVGFFATMTLAMVSRVTLGHSGRPLIADGMTWNLGLGLHGVALTRVLADVLPALAPFLLLAAGLGWLVVFVPWLVRLLPIYLSPRADGRPG